MKKTIRPVCKRLAMMAGLFLCASLTAGCSYGTKSDINELQKCIDRLTQDNYLLEQRVAALEANAPSAKPTPLPAAIVTITPEPGSTPRIHDLTADEICSSLLKNGMPVVSFTRYNANDDPDGLLGTNGGYTSRADFRDKTVSDVKGIIEVYASARDATLRMNAMEFARMQSNEPVPEEQLFCYDNVLMRLPEPFTEEQGIRYEDALRRILGLIG